MLNYACKILFLLIICLASNLSSKELIIGTTSAYAPYVSLNEEGEYIGFDIDIANLLGQKLKRTIKIQDLGSMPSLFLALRQNKIDLIIWAVSITKKREQQMEMIYYQGEKVTALPLLFWKEIPKNICSIQDMVGNKSAIIALEAGSFQESFLEGYAGLNLKRVDKVMDAILEIKYGKSQATMVDPSLLTKLTKQFPELKVMHVPLPENEQSLGNGICVNKKNCELTALISQAISELYSEGKINELEKKWGLTSTYEY